MAFLASNPLLAEAYKNVKNTAFQVKIYCESRSLLFANGGTESEILATVDNLNSMKAIIQNNATAPGLAEYAKIQEDDPLYDVVAEYLAMIAAIDSVLTYITNNIPAPRTFTAIQLEALKSNIDAVVLAID